MSDIKITLKPHFVSKTLYVCLYVRNVVKDAIPFPGNLKPLVVYRFYFITSSEFNAYQM